MDLDLAGATCPLCRGQELAVQYDLRELRGALDVPGRVARCCGCELRFKILKQDDDLSKYYSDEYAEGDHGDYFETDTAHAFFRAVLSRRPGARGRRLLDIGAGQGALVEEAGKLGFVAEGVDLCKAHVDKARAKGLAVTHAAAEDLVYENAFDVVTMMDIIEHVPDPLGVLGAAHRALKPGGELIVFTPNHRAAVVVLAEALSRVGIVHPVGEIFGRNHVIFFDDRSLPKMLAKAGFAVVDRDLFPYDTSRPGQEVSRVSLAAIAIVEQLGKPFGRVFRMLVYATKE